MKFKAIYYITEYMEPKAIYFDNLEHIPWNMHTALFVLLWLYYEIMVDSCDN